MLGKIRSLLMINYLLGEVMILIVDKICDDFDPVLICVVLVRDP